MNTLPDARDLVLGVLTRLRVLAPVGLLLWILGIEISPLLRLALVPAVLLALALDTIAHASPVRVYRVRSDGPET